MHVEISAALRQDHLANTIYPDHSASPVDNFYQNYIY